MTLVSNLSDDIPGLLKAALIFNGETPGGKSASLAILTDGDDEALIDLGNGLNARGDGLTQAMRSYISGLSQVGQILKARKIEDEDGVTEDDLERAALLFAFPKVGQNAKALAILKSHLDALQDKGIVAKADGTMPAPKPKPKMDAPKVEKDAAKPQAEPEAEDRTVIEKVAEAAKPLTLVAAGAAAAKAVKADEVSDDQDQDDDIAEDEDTVEAAAEVQDTPEEEVAEDTSSEDDADEGNGSLEELAATDASDEAKDEDESDEVKAAAPPRPSPAQVAQARLNTAPRKPSFFGR